MPSGDRKVRWSDFARLLPNPHDSRDRGRAKLIGLRAQLGRFRAGGENNIEPSSPLHVRQRTDESAPSA
jgi:hypothetical protein